MQAYCIADRQDALQTCLDHNGLLANDDTGRRDLPAGFKRERVAQTHGDATFKPVTIFQDERHL